MSLYRIGYGWGGVKVDRDTDEEAIAYAREYAGRTKGRRLLTVYKAAGGDWKRVHKEEL